MSDLCNVFRKAASFVHQWLTQQPAVKEESITDWLLYEVSRKAPEVTYIAFTRHEEARTTGADWEWWFLFSDGAVRLRVQAKRLFDRKDNYPELARTNRHGLQITKLLTDSATANAFPLYAFYHVEQSRSCPAGPTSEEGIHLASASRVDQTFLNQRSHVSAGDALALAKPISCLVCCPMSASSATDLIHHLRIYHEMPEDGAASEATGFHAKPPNFVISLVEAKGDVPEWWEREFSREIQDVSALLIVDRRGHYSHVDED